MAMVFCRGCGAQIHETAISCPQCGCQQAGAVKGNFKSQSVATVLAAFLGGFGIHRFYLNQPVLGVLYLLFCWTGIPGLIALVETFIFAFKSQQNWANDYNNGHLTAPVHGAVKILVLIFPVLFVVGILAAIAIPAYHSYTVRAKAAKADQALYQDEGKAVRVAVATRAPMYVFTTANGERFLLPA